MSKAKHYAALAACLFPPKRTPFPFPHRSMAEVESDKKDDTK